MGHLSPIGKRLAICPTLAATITILDNFLVFNPSVTLDAYRKRVALIGALKGSIFGDYPVTYAPIAAAANWDPPNHWGHRFEAFHQELLDLSTACVNGGGAMVTAVLVSSEDGIPGNAFYTLRASLRNVPVASTFADRVTQWHEELVALGMTKHQPK